jgi:hypothetical protein
LGVVLVIFESRPDALVQVISQICGFSSWLDVLCTVSIAIAAVISFDILILIPTRRTFSSRKLDFCSSFQNYPTKEV